jgi:hypothetical protein
MTSLQELMAKLQPCFRTLICFDEGKNPLECPLEAKCSNEWLRRKQIGKTQA